MRNWGVDRARLFAMFCVVLIHNNLQGGAFIMDLSSIHGAAYAFVENCGIVAVNLFAIITGYLMCDRTINLKKIFILWAEAIFWSGLVGVALYLCGEIGKTDLVISFFPVSSGSYWYLNAYFLMLPIIAFVNAGLSRTSGHDIALLAILLCLMGSLSSFSGWGNGMCVESGYSTIWLLILYIVGAAIKKNESSIQIFYSRRKILILSVTCPFLSILLERLYVEFGMNPWDLIQYNSPIVLAQSCLVFIVFLLFDGGTKYPEWLKLLSNSAFTVYLLDASLLFYKVLPGSFAWLSNISFIVGVPLLLLISLALFVLFLGAGIFRFLATRRLSAMSSVFCDRV